MRNSELVVLLVVGGILLALSGIQPHDYFTWVLEVAPILIVVPLLFATFTRFPFTRYGSDAPKLASFRCLRRVDASQLAARFFTLPLSTV